MYPGQGSQYPGMAKRAVETVDEALEVFEGATAYASKKMKRDIGKLMLEGPQEELNDTRVAQPTIFIANIVGSAALRTILEGDADGRVGHSFGHIAALHDDGVIDTHTGIDLSIYRGKSMHQASIDKPGAMAAVFQMAEEKIVEICQKWGVSWANDNSNTEAIISGEEEAIEAAMADIKNDGGKSIRLKVGLGAHSHLVEAAAQRMSRFADRLQSRIHMPEMPEKLSIMSSRTADYIKNIADVKADISGLTERVEWRRTITRLIRDDFVEFYETGPGSKLSNLPARDPKMTELLEAHGAVMKSLDQVIDGLGSQ